MVSDEEFEELKQVPHSKVLTESRLDNEEVAIVFAPRKKEDWPEIMKTLRLWQ
jgi:pantothenate synthetase